MIAERSEYKGCKMITLKKDENSKYPFSFGLNKAKMIVEAIEDIKKFIADCETASVESTVVDNSVKVDEDNMPF